METDQFVNVKLLVEDMRVAVRVCEGADSVSDPNELGRVIARSMIGDSLQKRRAKVMRGEVVKVVSPEIIYSLVFLISCMQFLSLCPRLDFIQSLWKVASPGPEFEEIVQCEIEKRLGDVRAVVQEVIQ